MYGSILPGVQMYTLLLFKVDSLVESSSTDTIVHVRCDITSPNNLQWHLHIAVISRNTVMNPCSMIVGWIIVVRPMLIYYLTFIDARVAVRNLVCPSSPIIYWFVPDVLSFDLYNMATWLLGASSGPLARLRFTLAP